jgi:hypothetical protein
MTIKMIYRCKNHLTTEPLIVDVDIQKSFTKEVYIKVNPCPKCREENIRKGHIQVTDRILHSMDRSTETVIKDLEKKIAGLQKIADREIAKGEAKFDDPA